tara:strand:- start:90410 stop:90568 length:159 start_codon:yes stop_codon:yes gene_type:complete
VEAFFMPYTSSGLDEALELLFDGFEYPCRSACLFYLWGNGNRAARMAVKFTH